MNSCPEKDKIRDFISGAMSAQERLRFQNHLDGCASCQRELSVEAAIDLELSRELAGPDIEKPVLRVLRLDEPARPFGWAKGSIKYFVLAILLFGFGSLTLPWLTRWSGSRVDFLDLSGWLNGLIQYGFGHPAYWIGIGGTIYIGSIIYTLARLKILRRII